MSYIIIIICAALLESISTLHIKAIGDKRIKAAALFALVGPLLNLPFYGFLVDSGTWIERGLMALCLGVGYAIGTILALFKKSE
jgi:hypothetical protein